jgi:hypothetical protein
VERNFFRSIIWNTSNRYNHADAINFVVNSFLALRACNWSALICASVTAIMFS